MNDLFGTPTAARRARESKDNSLWQTPQWACEAIVDAYYPDLTTSDLVLEPTCGEGHFLDAIPGNVPAIGIELNPELAAEARRRTGRRILVGDVRDVELDVTPTLIIGNPPFTASIVDALLDRAHTWLPVGGRCGLFLPSFLMDRVARVSHELERWETIATDTLPREIFPRLRFPIAFVRFEKRRSGRTLIGFALFPEMDLVRSLGPRARALLTHSRSPVWRAVVLDAIQGAGGEATLETIYRAVGPKRPTKNPFWREKVRQTCQRYFVRTARATYRLSEAAA